MSLTEKRSQDKASNIIDLIKLICCVLIIGDHAIPVFTNNIINHYYGAWFFRFCVPFFFIATGYFVAKMDQKKRTKYMIRIAVLYLISSVIYIPLYIDNGAMYIIFYLFFAFRHLWYLSALALSLLILEVANMRMGNKKYILFIMWPIAIFLDEYFKLFNLSGVEGISFMLENTGIITLFRSIPLLLVGDFLYNKKITAPVKYCTPAFILLMLLGFLEARFLLNHLHIDTTLDAAIFGTTPDASIFGWMPAVPLFLIGIQTPSFLKASTSRSLRKVVDLVYIIHIWMIYIAENCFNLQLMPRFIAATVLSFILAAIISIVITLIGKNKKTRLS